MRGRDKGTAGLKVVYEEGNKSTANDLRAFLARRTR